MIFPNRTDGGPFEEKRGWMAVQLDFHRLGAHVGAHAVLSRDRLKEKLGIWLKKSCSKYRVW